VSFSPARPDEEEAVQGQDSEPKTHRKRNPRYHLSVLASTEQKLPQVFGRYLLLRRLSRGGMGEIFLARSGQLAGFEKLCVIKKVLPSLAADREFISRFIDEAQVCIKLSHANIAQVFEVGMVDDEYFLALEYVEGRDLRRIVAELHDRSEKLPLDLALWVVREIASGLAYAHRKTNEDGEPLNVVHCDMSPPNVVVSFEGDVKIIDFGIAKSALRISQTNPAVGFGKFGYMAPEQVVRGGVVDRRTDLYATGVMLYELLTGERLFQFPEGTDYRAIARAVTSGQHPLPSQRDAKLAPFDAIVARALAPDPTNRYASAEELRDAVQTQLARVNPHLTADRLGAFVRQHFEEEVTEERQLLREMRAIDLSAYAEELTDSEAHTVSFATVATKKSLLPPAGASPDAPETVIVDEAVTSPTPLPSPTPAFAAIVERPRRSSWPLYMAVAAVFLVAGVILTRIVLRDNRAASASPPPVLVTALPPQEPAAPPAAPAMETPPAPASVAVKPATPAPSARPPRRARPQEAPPPAPAPEVLDPDTVKQRFLAVKREYEAFRRQYGNRFEADYNEILELQTFGGEGKLEKLDTRLGALKKKMAETRRSE